LHPVARALSRLSGKNRPSQQLFKAFIVFYTSTATFFGLHWPSSVLYYVFRLMMASEGRKM
jgi:hypothetical protein